MARIARHRSAPRRGPALAGRLAAAGQIVGAALAIAALCAMALGAQLVGAPPRLHPQTLCPIDAPAAAHFAVILDRTDPWDRQATILAARTIERLKSELPVHARLTAHLVTADPEQAATAVLDLCNPGDGSTVDGLTGNPRRAQHRFETGFEAPIADLLADLSVAARADRSPILEALAAMAGAMDPDLPRHIVLISDLLQNSAMQSHYRRPPDAAAALASAAGARLTDGRLVDVRVTLVRMPNAGHAARQNAALIAFWIELVRAGGGVATIATQREGGQP